jgi:hypothetical protein
MQVLKQYFLEFMPFNSFTLAFGPSSQKSQMSKSSFEWSVFGLFRTVAIMQFTLKPTTLRTASLVYPLSAFAILSDTQLLDLVSATAPFLLAQP